MKLIKTCSFLGHRTISVNNALIKELKTILENLILNENVSHFLFGSKSQFDDLCHKLINELKEKYPYIKRIAYTCKNESIILENEKKQFQGIYERYSYKDINYLCFDEEFEHKTKWLSGKACYIERNKAMIDNSDYCIFYFNPNYTPTTKTKSINNTSKTPKHSGTKIAYNYAIKQNKICYNLFTS